MTETTRPDDEIPAIYAANLTERDVGELIAFRQSVTWELLKKVMHAMRKQSDVGLRNPLATIDVLRNHQGRVGQINELVNFLEVDLPEWYNKRTTQKGRAT